MNTKTWFVRLALISAILLVAFLIPLNRCSLFTMTLGGGFALYNLLVDIVIGAFAIWALFWAASEFAGSQIKPDLYLIVGREPEDQTGIDPVRNETDELYGRDGVIDSKPVSQLVIGLFLENAKPKTATFIRMTLRVSGVPTPIHFEPIPGSFQYTFKQNIVKNEAVFIQFGQDLLVYQGGVIIQKGDGVYLGNIKVAWPAGTQPERITIEAALYSLESKPKYNERITRPIRWLETPDLTQKPKSDLGQDRLHQRIVITRKKHQQHRILVIIGSIIALIALRLAWIKIICSSRRKSE